MMPSIIKAIENHEGESPHVKIEFLNIANKIDPVRAVLPAAKESTVPLTLGNQNVIVDAETGFSLHY